MRKILRKFVKLGEIRQKFRIAYLLSYSKFTAKIRDFWKFGENSRNYGKFSENSS